MRAVPVRRRNYHLNSGTQILWDATKLRTKFGTAEYSRTITGTLVHTALKHEQGDNKRNTRVLGNNLLPRCAF